MTVTLYWNCIGRNQGQIVEISDAQLAGAAEGDQGPASGLSLRYDRSDRSWSVWCGNREVGVGVGEKPTVDDAMRWTALIETK
jgi:hypothetical protein